MDMDSLAILVKAILSLKDVTDSKKQIASELPKLESQLQSDKNTRVKIIAGLDVAKSKKVIQSQIDTLSSQLNGNTIKVGLEVTKNNGIQNIVGGLKQAEIQAQKTNSSLTNLTDKFKEPIKPVLSKEGLIDAKKTIALLEQRFQALDGVANVSVKGLYSDKESVDNLDKMIVSLKNGQQEARTLTFALDEAGKAFYLIKGTSDNSGVKKFIDQIEQAQNKLKELEQRWKEQGILTGEFENQVESLKTELSNVGDIGSLDKYNNSLKLAQDNAKKLLQNRKQSIDVEKQLTSAISELNKIQNSSTFSKNASNPQVKQTQNEIKELKNDYQSLLAEFKNNPTPQGLENIKQKLAELDNRFDKTITSAEAFENQLKSNNGAKQLSQKVELLTQQIKAYLEINTKAANSKEFGGQFSEILLELTNPNIDIDTFNKLQKKFQVLRQEINATGKAGKTFFQTLGDQAKKFSSWMTLTGVISGLWREMRKMVDEVIELDNSLLELSKVSDLSASGLKKVTKEAYELGKEVGKTGTQVIDAVTNFKRAGFDLEKSTSLAKDALILTNVAEGINDASDAATALISIMKGYGDVSPEFSQKILDAINEVSNTQAINFDDLVDGSQRLSAVANQAGASFEQMLGILTGTNEVMQNIEKTASGQITIFTRLQGIQLPDEEDVMPVAKLQKTISDATKGAANVVDSTTGELRNVYDILNDINKVWDTLDKNTQEGIAFAAAGTRQKNVFLSMMENWENVEKATESAMDSSNSAIVENQKYLDSIQGRLANLESSFQSLSNTVIESDLIKTVVDGGATILNLLESLVDTFGTLGTIGLGAGIFAGVKNVGRTKMYVLN